jgi:hypothetical protein
VDAPEVVIHEVERDGCCVVLDLFAERIRQAGEPATTPQPSPYTSCTTTSGGSTQTLRVTPAMEAGVTDHVWSVEEIVDLLG